ncbi:hypothetical protein DFQ28_010813 [Apophysomyces sp. BC1034]|nr:hypothetical protein DFQ30_010515 [Apophysomyces sp. BC1015]KAG0170325.1 hypothetical protein DFQ29_009326 [Apophysomyces sp. BC1021]KAG0184633.1 hypothetical protein DFQ28_010813 [Apophysomyces sp. BC1034]
MGNRHSKDTHDNNNRPSRKRLSEPVSIERVPKNKMLKNDLNVQEAIPALSSQPVSSPSICATEDEEVLGDARMDEQQITTPGVLPNDSNPITSPEQRYIKPKRTRSRKRATQQMLCSRSSLSCSTIDSGWATSGGLFSQINPNTNSSVITTLTDHSTFSRHSLFNQDWPNSSDKKMVLTTAASTAMPSIAQTSSTPPYMRLLSRKSTVSKDKRVVAKEVLQLLGQAQESNCTYRILKETFAKAQWSDNPQDRNEAFIAASIWCQNTDDPVARVWVARCLLEGWGIAPDPAQGFSQLKTLAKDGCPHAFYPLGLCYLRIQNNPTDAFSWFKTAAEIDFDNLDPEAKELAALAQCRVAAMLFKGEGVFEDAENAWHWFLKSAKNGNKYAQYMVGVHYERGLIVEKDDEKAAYYFSQSAEQGFAEAQTVLGIRLMEQKKYSEGICWLERAVDMRHPRALLKFGIMYEFGEGVEHDDRLALEHYETAAELNDPVAQYLLGLHYRLGQLGLAQNDSEAERYLTLSAKSGYGPAQRVLGLMYAQGLAGERRCDYKTALRWFRRAASRGDVRALGLVAHCFEHGYGVAVDHKSALDFYSKAASIDGPFQDAARLAKAMLLHRMGRHHHALDCFTKAAGHETIGKKAKLMIARYHLHGWAGEKDPNLAFNMLTELANADDRDAGAHYWLGACFEEGLPGTCERELQKAFDHYLLAAEAGDVDGEFQVALMLSNGQGVVRNRLVALDWYQKAATKGHRTALYSLGLYYAKGLEGVQKDLDKAQSCFEKAARLGLPSAMSSLAAIYRLNHKNEQAVYWYRKAAGLGDVVAQRELGMLHDGGLLGIPQDYATAFDLLQKAAGQLDAQATLLLGSYYQNGFVVEKDTDRAIQLYLEAAQLGAPVAPFAAAQIYHSLNHFEEAYTQYKTAANDDRLTHTRIGKTAKLMMARYVLSYVPSSDDHHNLTIQNMENITKQEAYDMLYQLATRDQFGPSYYWLGDCLRHGHGVQQSMSDAARWFTKAADEMTDAEAMVRLGMMYEQGEGVPVDKVIAFRYFQKSAEKDHAEGLYKMGMTYWQGFLTSVNLHRAVEYFTRSAAQKHTPSYWALGQMAWENNDWDLAQEWWQKGASQNHVPSARSLAKLLLQIKHDDAEAQHNNLMHILDLLTIGAWSNDAESLILLGQVHQMGAVTTSQQRLRSLTGSQPRTIDDGYIDDNDDDVEEEIALQKQQEEQEVAVQLFERAAALGHVDAMFLAGQAWHAQEQYAAALEFYERAAAHGHLLSRVMRARYRLEGLGGIKADPEAGFKELEACAEVDQCADAHNSLAQCYERGLGTAPDDALALRWYLLSAQTTKDAEAMFRIGQMYAQGRVDVQRSDQVSEAWQWYTFACETQDHPGAHYCLGLYCLQGVCGRTPDVAAALDHFLKAAKQNNHKAMFKLGQILVLSDDPAYSAEEQHDGIEWLERAAQLGSQDAQRELGKLCHTGKDVDNSCIVEQDFQKAYDLFYRAARQGDHTSMLFLGSYYEHGIHAAPSTETAKEWYRSAIDTNDNDHRWLAELAMAQLLHQEKPSQEAYAMFQAAYDHATELSERRSTATMLARYDINGWGNVPIRPESFTTIIRLAEAGEHKTFLDAAKCYESGIGVKQNLAKAFAWYSRLVTLRDQEDDLLDEEDEEQLATALFKLAEFYRQGLIGPIDRQKAEDLYHLAADKGA